MVHFLLARRCANCGEVFVARPATNGALPPFCDSCHATLLADCQYYNGGQPTRRRHVGTQTYQPVMLSTSATQRDFLPVNAPGRCYQVIRACLGPQDTCAAAAVSQAHVEFRTQVTRRISLRQLILIKGVSS